MRTRIDQNQQGHVTLEHIDLITEQHEERVFTAPAEHGYVRELQSDGSTRQPCECLDRLGPTLMASEETLLAVIRREYRKMRRLNQAEINRSP